MGPNEATNGAGNVLYGVAFPLRFINNVFQFAWQVNRLAGGIGTMPLGLKPALSVITCYLTQLLNLTNLIGYCVLITCWLSITN